MKKIVLIIAAFAVASMNLIAQSELPEFAPDEAKVLKKVKFDFPKEGRSTKSGGGYSVSMKNLKSPPKRVALVSFFTFDPGCNKTYYVTRSEDQIWLVTYKVTKQRANRGNAGLIAEGMYYSGIENMINKFKSYGMDLLMPEQFLDTKEKEDAYNSFEVEHGGLGNWASNLGNTPENDIYGYLDGYKIMKIVAEPTANYEKSGLYATMGYKNNVSDAQIFSYNSDSKMMNSLGFDLCKKLEVDAVLIVYATIYVPKEKRIMLQNVNMTMFGLNPIQLGENDKKPFFYHNGQFYCGARVQPDCQILNIKKKDPETEKLNFKGFNEILGALSTKIGDYLTGKDD